MSRFSAEFLFASALLVGALFHAGFPEPRKSEIEQACASTAMPSKDLGRLAMAASAIGNRDCAERLGKWALWLAPDEATRTTLMASLAPLMTPPEQAVDAPCAKDSAPQKACASSPPPPTPPKTPGGK